MTGSREELARKAALFREGTRRIYDAQGDRADMWYFDLWHFLGDVQESLSVAQRPADCGAAWIDQNYQIDRYGVALMMIREGCADPAGLARRVLSEFGPSVPSTPLCTPDDGGTR